MHENEKRCINEEKKNADVYTPGHVVLMRDVSNCIRHAEFVKAKKTFESVNKNRTK